MNQKKRSLLGSIFGLTCPRCRQAKLFETPTFSFNRPGDMPKNCPNCGQDFMPEPGYYYGAMFVSYIFTGWFCIGFVLFFHWVLGWSTVASFALLIAFMGIFFIYTFRLARSIWIHITERYDPNAGLDTSKE